MEKSVEFLESLQELSAALVLVDPEDPGSFQTVMGLLDRLLAHPLAQCCVDVRTLLESIQKLVEESLFHPGSYSAALAKMEKDLEKLNVLVREEDGKASPDEEHATEPPGRPEAEKLQADESAAREEPPSPPALSMEADRALYEDFLTEARESIESIEVKILELEQDPLNVSVINEIFRPFHTIKGVSGFLNLNQIRRLTHAVEDLLDQARKGKTTMGKPEIDLILESVDLLRRLLECVWSWLAEGKSEDLGEEVDRFVARLHGRGGGGAGAVEDRCRAESSPGQTLNSPGEAAQQESAQDSEGSPGREAVDGLGRQQGTASQASPSPQMTKGSPTVKVDMYKLDNLVNMVGELVIAQSLVAQNSRIRSVMDHTLSKDFGQLARITSELRRTAMALRMVPIRQTFQKMIRLVRDLTQKSGKLIHLNMIGEETEIDRNMVDAIYEPLVHLVRNAVDHGLESPEERKQAGKPETGTLELRSYQQGGNVVIEVADDGRGLNRERILAKARLLGLVGEEERPSDREIDEMIFRPGFSTAREVTDVSGRGVGMDVVRKTVEGLRGKIEIRSRLGEGTTFVMRLPITLAIIDGMVVRVGKERFILPTVNIREAVRPTRKECFTVKGRGEMIEIRGALLPVIRLHEVLHIDSERIPLWDGLVIVAENQGEKRCLLVNEVLAKQEVVIKSLGKGFEQPEGIAGGSILGDGGVGLILDIDGIFRLQQKTVCGANVSE
jgi:two-component system chemotaxis sensor kinase CheA